MKHYYEQCTDHGPNPFAVNIHGAAIQNTNFRTTLWSGTYLQLTLMNIPVCGEIGLEKHADTDQFLRIESGDGLVMMGESEKQLNFRCRICDGCAVFVPAGRWHNIINTGKRPLKLYSIYAPPHHLRGTIHKTKAEADAEEE